MFLKYHRTQEGEETRDKDNVVIAYGIKYLVTGAKDKNEAMELIFKVAPKRIDRTIMVFNGVKFDGYDEAAIKVIALYKKEEAPKEGAKGAGAAMQTSIITSFKQTGYGEEIQKTDGTIGWNGKNGMDSLVSGLEMYTLAAKETHTKAMKIKDVTEAFRQRVAELTGKVNSSSFLKHNAGEVLFTGAEYDETTEANGYITVKFNFSIRKNQTNIKFPDSNIEIPLRKGWEYLWAITNPTVNSETQKVELKVQSAYLEQIYQEASFAALGL